jgi:transposase
VPTVNKQSLREEFTALRERFGQLSTDGKVGAESRALIEALLMLMQVLMAVFMEKNTPKTSTNSSRPSSRTEKDESAVSTHPGTHTKGKPYDPSRSANTRTVETVQVSKVSSCEECGEDLRDVPPDGHERRTQIDIVFEKVLSHVDAQIKSCPHCDTQTRAPFPQAFCGPVQYGAGIKAYVLNLLIAQMISLRRVQHSIQSLIGLVISEATILKYVLQLHLALARWEQMAIDRLLTEPAMHVDETSIRVEKHNHWIHVCCRRADHPEVRARKARAGSNDRHRHHPALWWGDHPRLLGVIPLL